MRANLDSFFLFGIDVLLHNLNLIANFESHPRSQTSHHLKINRRLASHYVRLDLARSLMEVGNIYILKKKIK